MNFNHEIPKGGTLYFGKMAALKRRIENHACAVFEAHGFEEILTPAFSFLEHQHNFSNRKIIRLNSQENEQLSLRYDSTIDAIRILTKRLMRSTEGKKWFYIQPVFSYPSNEIHQIGAECLDASGLKSLIELALCIITGLEIEPCIQISHTQIPKLCAKHLGLEEKQMLEKSLDELMQTPVLRDLITLKSIQDLAHFIPRAPHFLQDSLQMLLSHARACEQFSQSEQNIIITALKKAPVDYYSDILFKVFVGNDILLLGGNYQIDSMPSCGFGIYTDHVINHLGNKE